MGGNRTRSAAHAIVLRFGLVAVAAGDDLSQTLLLSQSHHDPNAVWSRSRVRLTLVETRADGASRTSLVVIDVPGLAFELKTKVEGRQVVMSVFDDVTSASLDGRLDFSKADAEKFGLTSEGVTRQRNHYEYLYGLPMKVNDRGAIVGLPMPASKFEGRSATKLRVTHDPKVSRDAWDFFFDSITNALIGYQVFHDVAKNEGEFVMLRDEINCGASLRLPKVRARYAHPNRAYLGRDTIDACSVEPILVR